MKYLKYKILSTPPGILKIVASEKALVATLWDNEKLSRVRLENMIEDKNHPILLQTENQLIEYFLKERKTFELPLEATGTVFQKEVWNILPQIPYGATSTYKEIAAKIKRPNAMRAVGTAIGRNPLSIIIPCHRIIASDGDLAGYAGGLDRKRFLLDLEGF